jgi:hypothetical protein
MAVLASGLVLTAPLACRAAGGAIESGQYTGGELATNIEQRVHTYFFFTLSNDTVIIRSASSDQLYPGYTPRRTVYFPSNFVSDPDYGVYAVSEAAADMVITNISKPGWWKMDCTLPTPLLNISNTYSYSLSMLRMVDYPLSYQDPDVGTIRNGQSLGGTIHVSADIDAGFFEVTNRCTVQVRMGQKNFGLVPNMQLYDPDGRVISADLPPEYRAEITAVLTNPGVYTIVCADKFIGVGQYNLAMVRIPGVVGTDDPDVGRIVSGDSIMGTINEPGDLDLAYFSVLAGDTIRVAMRDYSDADSALNPRLELYSPTGDFLARAADPFQYEAVITNTCATNGFYYVICKDSEDRKDVRYLLSFNILSGPSLSSIPAPPTNVTASQGLYPNYIMVSWDAVTNASGYDVYRSFGTNAVLAIATNVPTASYLDYDVTTNRLYTYRVKSRNSYGTSALSEPANGYCLSDFVSARRRALVIGLDNYSPDYPVSPLFKCVADARGIRDTLLLGDPRRRWTNGAVQMLTDQAASKTKVREMLTLLAHTATNGDLVLYSQSSHGGQSSGTDTYLCMYDASYTDAELAADLALFSNGVTIVVIADTCHSGGLFKNREAGWPFARRVMEEYQALMTARYRARGEAPPQNLGQNIGFMTACDYNEFSYEGESNGFYTGFLLQGCGLTAVDTNRDGEYQFLELHTYAADKLLTNSPVQHAQSYNDDLLAATIARARGSGGGGATNRIVLPECDYDGDRQSDLAVYEPASGAWYIYSLRSGPLAWALPWGGPGMIPVSGDFNGDRVTDLAVYELNTGCWYIRTLAYGLVLAFGDQWGGRNMMPVAADYNADAITDLAVYDLVNGYWYIRTLSGVTILWGVSFWGTGFVAVPGDYNGDGVADLAQFHVTSGAWIINTLYGDLILAGVQWGAYGMMPVSGDYNGDGVYDLAVYEPSTGYWYIRTVSGAVLAWQAAWGGPTLAAVPGDFDGDGTSDMAVYDGYTGGWYVWSVPERYPVLWQGLWGGYGFLPAKPNW